VDFTEAWTKSTDATKRTIGTSAALVTNTLDALSPVCVPLAARWDREADRRDALRTPENLKALIKAQRDHASARSTTATARAQRQAARANSSLVSRERRTTGKALKAARDHERSARAALKVAAANHPQRLVTVATKAHAAHLLGTSAASYLMSTADSWTVWPAGGSVAVIVANAAALWLGRRQITVTVGDDLSAEERALFARLDPSHWAQHADDRGLSGTITTPPQITPAGIVCGVRLDGRWTVRELKAKTDNVRSLLGMRTDTRMEITTGSQGDWARLIIRTRSASDGIDMTGWRPGDPWALSMEDGAIIPVPLGKRILLAGTSGSGKSWSARPLLAEASEHADHRLVIFDRKHVEARNWEHRARTACELDEMREVAAELIAEGERRLKTLPRGKDVVPISADQPRITVFVDEGAELLADCKKRHEDVIEGLRTIARKYRAAEIILVWATQKPALSGASPGLDTQIGGQLTVRLSLAVATSTESRVVFGDDAAEDGWNAHKLPMPGVALLRDQDKGPKSRPAPLKMRAMSPMDVINLPARPVWQLGAGVPAPAPAPAIEAAETVRPVLRLVKDGAAELPHAAPESAAEVDGLTDNQRAVLEAVRSGATTNAEISKATGLNPGSVARAVDALVKRDLLAKDGTAIRLGGAA